MPSECIYCRDVYGACDNFLVNTRKLVERSLDDYAYVGVQAWIEDESEVHIFAVTDKNKTFASEKVSFEINYCPMCGRKLRGVDNG